MLSRLLAFFLLSLPCHATQEHLLEGVFTTKIPSLSALNSDDFTPGDIAFFAGAGLFFEKDNPDFNPEENISFLNTLKEKGIPCFCLAARPRSYRNKFEVAFQRNSISFTPLP